MSDDITYFNDVDIYTFIVISLNNLSDDYTQIVMTSYRNDSLYEVSKSSSYVIMINVHW